MVRRIVLMSSVVAAMLVLASGVALALNQITCTGGICEGTSKADQITGTSGTDSILAGGGNDIVDALSGNDGINGNRGSDKLTGGEGTDALAGDEGNDTLDLRDNTGSALGQLEYALGSAGNDYIYAEDGNTDYISCGPGNSDSVTYDQFDFFMGPSPGEFVSSPTPDCEKAVLINP